MLLHNLLRTLLYLKAVSQWQDHRAPLQSKHMLEKQHILVDVFELFSIEHNDMTMSTATVSQGNK